MSLVSYKIKFSSSSYWIGSNLFMDNFELLIILDRMVIDY